MKNIIEIEKRFEKNLRERFDEGNAVIEGKCYLIKITCRLCETYSLKDCKKCPFNYFASQWRMKGIGCDAFIRMITHTEKLPILLGFNVIRWNTSEDKEARAFLKLLCKEAKKKIRFV